MLFWILLLFSPCLTSSKFFLVKTKEGLPHKPFHPARQEFGSDYMSETESPVEEPADSSSNKDAVPENEKASIEPNVEGPAEATPDKNEEAAEEAEGNATVPENEEATTEPNVEDPAKPNSDNNEEAGGNTATEEAEGNNFVPENEEATTEPNVDNPAVPYSDNNEEAGGNTAVPENEEATTEPKVDDPAKQNSGNNEETEVTEDNPAFSQIVKQLQTIMPAVTEDNLKVLQKVLKGEELNSEEIEIFKLAEPFTSIGADAESEIKKLATVLISNQALELAELLGHNKMSRL